MTYTAILQGNDPILLVTASDPYDFRSDSAAVRAEICAAFGGSGKPFVVIYDIRALSFTFNDMVVALADTIYSQDDSKGIFQKYGMALFVSAGPLISLVIESFNRLLSARGRARAFTTLTEALDYARTHVNGTDYFCPIQA